MVQFFVGLKPWKLYFFGSMHKNETGIGILIIPPKEIPTKFKFKVRGHFSNNKVVYETLIAGLKILLDLGGKVVEIRDDSELVVKQLTKKYKCMNENLILYFVKANSLLRRFHEVDIKHVPRVESPEANNLA